MANQSTNHITPPPYLTGGGLGGGSRIESQIIASLMWGDYQRFAEVSHRLKAEHFDDKDCRAVYEALQKRAEHGQELSDLVMLAEELRQQGHKELDVPWLMELTTDSRAVVELSEYVDSLLDRTMRRKAVALLQTYEQKAQDQTVPVTDTLTKAINDLLLCCTGMPEDSQTLADMLPVLRQRITDNAEGRVLPGVQTGFRRLDGYGGLHDGDLIIIGAASSQGKTSLALTMAMNGARLSGAQVAVYSLEMSALQLTSRMLSAEAALPASVLMYRRLTENTIRQVDEAAERISPYAPFIHFDESSLASVDDIIGSIRMHHARYGVRMAIVDYLQIVNLGLRDMKLHELALAEAARRFKNVAKELGICIILLSQLNRDTSGTMVPSVDRLRGSGQINEASDLTMILYRPEVENKPYPGEYCNVDTHGTAMLRVVKDRNGGYGGIGDFFLRFVAQTMHFEDLDKLTYIGN